MRCYQWLQRCADLPPETGVYFIKASTDSEDTMIGRTAASILAACLLSLSAAGMAFGAHGHSGGGGRSGGHSAGSGGFHGGGNGRHFAGSGFHHGGGRVFIPGPIYAPVYYPRPYYYRPPVYQYFCPVYGAYYPYVQDCPGGWVTVAPRY